MAIVEMLMPKMGESIIEGTVLTWLKNEGDTIEQDESVLEVATDKVDTEVPSIHAGILKQILAKEGEVIAVGAPIAIIETTGNEKSTAANSKQKVDPTKENLIVSAPENTATTLNSTSIAKSGELGDDRYYSPLVQSIAREEGISKAELAKVPGTGKDARVTKQDMLNYLESKSQPTKQPTSIPSISAPKVQVSVSGEDEIIEMDRMRKMIAQRMITSKQISAHVTSFVEADMTNIVLWRERNKLAYKAKFGESITYTPFFIEAVAKAIRDFPMINISVDGDRIIRKKEINVGMAVALQNGNLIVPVIRKADQLNLVGISKKVNELANLARNNKLNADHLAGGTYTVSNVGSFGNVMGTPIIPQPQVAIMAVGAIVKKPAVVETPTGDVIAIRHKMFLSHTYDHRVVDGSLGGKFVKRVSDYLEAFDINTPL
ncbi:dihydrolipoamide acetyltransferase family protein [Algoriphagus sp. C2-6-M1]|uniref:dihydrolipoamide acetyltransferase family protein n=1 Tax=Algoriphagus persicinus TaxID=3108754 RepID=UPI002B37DCD0|nr:dihydrolipoamide acetyltransferase family protein [Algoriphagus sp. C2-6-M1]MEB2781192.1 dihydrolipoamide acetyltransferase family protein [Algoriphagus sp. C2-6-M1]